MWIVVMIVSSRETELHRQQTTRSDLAVPYEDPIHHDRFILIGMSLQSNLLLVVFAERAGGNTVRIISARRAT